MTYEIVVKKEDSPDDSPKITSTLVCDGKIISVNESPSDKGETEKNLFLIRKSLSDVKQPGSEIIIYVDNHYVRRAANEWVAQWASPPKGRRPWQTKNGKPVKYINYWRDILRIIKDYTVIWTWATSEQDKSANPKMSKSALNIFEATINNEAKDRDKEAPTLTKDVDALIDHMFGIKEIDLPAKSDETSKSRVKFYESVKDAHSEMISVSRTLASQKNLVKPDSLEYDHLKKSWKIIFAISEDEDIESLFEKIEALFKSTSLKLFERSFSLQTVNQCKSIRIVIYAEKDVR